MENAPITTRLAPCGLRCDACLSRRDGAIHQAAQTLLAGLAGFSAHHRRFAAMNSAFAHYPAFEAVLEYLAQGQCRGCRLGDCLFKGCAVQSCEKLGEVDFCFQCERFPCQALDGHELLKKNWLAANRAMARLGPEEYWRSVKDKPRY